MAKKKKKKPQPKQPPAPARFSVGELVRVKPGTTVPDFEDIPLGGWVGTITEVDQTSTSAFYEIEWNHRTLDAMHPVFLKRSARDGLEIESMWLGENDLELDIGEPLTIEQPTQIVTRPLKLNVQEDRIRSILGLSSDDSLPFVNEDNLRRYHRHLAEKLTFPFEAKVYEDIGLFQRRANRITVTGLLGPDAGDVDEGLLCKALADGEPIELPLTDVEDAPGPDRRLIEDYSFWFVNWPNESEVEADECPDDEPRGEIVHVPDLVAGTVNPWAVVTTIIQSSLFGGFFGLVLGAGMASLEGALVGAKTGAILLALVGGWMGASSGEMIGATNRLRHGHWFGGIAGIVLGAIFGGLLGVMLVAFMGALLGGLVGGLLGWLVEAKENKPFRTLNGLIAGAMLGVLVHTWLHAAEDAYSGMWIGGIAGAVAGPVLYFTMIVFLVGFDADRS